jgi:colanic acid biosynthesis protein WcaH
MEFYIDESLYQKVHELMPIFCVDVILKIENKFLMVKRTQNPAKGQWWFPGGRVYKNERLLSAVKRKVLEETSLKIKHLEKIVDTYEIFFEEAPFNHNNGTHTLSNCYLGEIRDYDQITLNKYHSKYKVFSNYGQTWHPYLKHCLKKASFSSNG